MVDVVKTAPDIAFNEKLRVNSQDGFLVDMFDGIVTTPFGSESIGIVIEMDFGDGFYGYPGNLLDHSVREC